LANNNYLLIESLYGQRLELLSTLL